MRIEVKDRSRARKDKLGIGLIVVVGGLLTFAYILGAPAYASAFPLPVERALTNLRNEMNKATEGLGYTISEIVGTVKSITGR
jgi:hypothetical protein